MNIIVHYELKNEDILPYILKSAFRFLIKKNSLFKFEKILLNFIKTKILKSMPDRKLLEDFKELRKQLIETSQNQPQAPILDYLISWIESKIENRSFVEIVREKASK